MDLNSSRIDRLDEVEKTEFIIKLTLDGFPDGLLRKISGLSKSERKRVVAAMYNAVITTLDFETTSQLSSDEPAVTA